MSFTNKAEYSECREYIFQICTNEIGAPSVEEKNKGPAEFLSFGGILINAPEGALCLASGQGS